MEIGEHPSIGREAKLLIIIKNKKPLSAARLLLKAP